MSPVTDVLVPGRGHSLAPNGLLCLSPSSLARLETTVTYYMGHVESFEERSGLVCFEGGWAAAAAGMSRPPENRREGRLMRTYAINLGMAAGHCVEGIESTTTMANCLQARRHFAGVGRLAIVAQVSQADRLLYCAGRVLPDVALSIIEAPGEDDPAIIEDEQRLLHQSRLLYGWARGSRTLELADRFGMLLGRLAGVRPGERYGAIGDTDGV